MGYRGPGSFFLAHIGSCYMIILYSQPETNHIKFDVQPDLRGTVSLSR